MTVIPSHVAQVLARLAGPAVLLPIPRNQKGPVFQDWPQTTLAAMSNPAYLSQFQRSGNIGVLLGEPSEGLCTVDLDSEEVLKAFLSVNPELSSTLQTSRMRGGNLWLRILGKFPAAGKIKDHATGRDLGEWRANGNQTVIHGAAIDTTKGETKPTQYRTLVDAPPLKIAFSQIVWPGGWRVPWMPEPEEAGIAANQELIAEHGEPFTKSDNGRLTLNAMYFIARFARSDDTLYEPAESQFYGYDLELGLWRRRTEAAIKIDLAEALKEYADGQSNGVKGQIVNSRTPAALAGMASLLQGFVEETDAFNRVHGVVHVANGMLHLAGERPELRPFEPQYRSRNIAPVAYDPAAECPRFKRELLESALDAADVSLVQRYFGACLLGRNLAQKLLILTGTAGGGKSTLLEILEKILGIENVGQLRTEHLAERFEIARFVGRLLLTGKDVPGRFLEESGAHALKALVGHDLLDAERKGSNLSVPVRGDFAVVITCNSRLRVRLDGDADAWRRRLLIVKYERPKPERPERDFANRLLAEEGAGILRWMVDGARAHLAELAECGDYRLTDTQRQRVNSLLAESDSLREFIRQRTEVHHGSDVTVYELVEVYAQYCDSQGWEQAPVRRVELDLPDAMQEIRKAARRNDVQREGKSRRGFAGVRLIENAGEAADHDA